MKRVSMPHVTFIVEYSGLGYKKWFRGHLIVVEWVTSYWVELLTESTSDWNHVVWLSLWLTLMIDEKITILPINGKLYIAQKITMNFILDSRKDNALWSNKQINQFKQHEYCS